MSPHERDTQQTKWAATFLIAGELAKRGWNVGLTHGNTATEDILAHHPESGRHVTIDSKGIRAPGHWFGNGLVGEQRKKDHHFMVFVAIPFTNDPARFYIVPARKAVEMADYNRVHPGPRVTRPVPSLFESPRRDSPQMKTLELFRDRWDLLQEA